MSVASVILPKSVYTGWYLKCRIFSGVVNRYSVCQLYFRSPSYTGLAELYMLRKPAANLILGKMSQIQNHTHEEVQCWYESVGLTANVVATRAELGRRMEGSTAKGTDRIMGQGTFSTSGTYSGSCELSLLM